MSVTDDILTCPTCGPAWDGRYDTDHRCETCQSILLAREGRDECERLKGQAEALRHAELVCRTYASAHDNPERAATARALAGVMESKATAVSEGRWSVS